MLEAAPVGQPIGFGGGLGASAPVSLNDKRSFLYLISPRQFYTVYNRPLLYKFSDNFIDKARTAILPARNNAPTIIDGCLASQDALTSIMPSSTGYGVNLSQMSYSWTFFLVVDNHPVYAGQRAHSMASNRVLYCGYCTDEPLSPLTNSPNTDCTFVITKKVLMNQFSTYTPGGGASRTQTMANFDVVPSTVIKSLTNQHTFVMTPGAMVDPVEDGILAVSDIDALGVGTTRNVQVQSDLSVPHNNLKKVLSGLAQANQYLVSEDTETLLMSNSSSMAVAKEYFSDQADPLRDTGLNENSVITFGSIIQRYHPDVLPIKIPNAPTYDVRDQENANHSNIYSALFNTAIPAAMTEFTFLDVSFRHNTYTGEFEIYSLSPAIPLSDAELQQKVAAFRAHLQSRVFSIPVLSHGHYEVNASYQCAGIGTCILYFLDDGVVDKSVYETPNIFGGLVNSLIGTSREFSSNSMEMYNLSTYILDVDRDFNGYGPMRTEQSYQTDFDDLGNSPDTFLRALPSPATVSPPDDTWVTPGQPIGYQPALQPQPGQQNHLIIPTGYGTF